MIIAGIDEAGYGPTLGPLVIAVCVFRVPDPASPEGGAMDLWRLLERAVCRKPDKSRVAVGDSKKLFHQKQGVRRLEEGVLPFIHLRHGSLPRDFRSLLEGVARRGGAAAAAEEGADSYLDAYPWYKGRNLEIPADTYAGVIRSRAGLLRAAMAEAGVEVIGLAAWPVEVLEFNRRLEDWRNKARVSFQAISSFLKRLWKQFPDDAVEVMVDRQGGRMRYGPLLFESIRPRSIRVESQSEEFSAYSLVRRSGAASKPFRVSFAIESEERWFAVALASMLSKYLRELHMLLFNRFWAEISHGIRPTAGYALDARRFLDETMPLRRRLGIDDALLVRRR